jgi:transcriptional regulator with XRE-family HTH domain
MLNINKIHSDINFKSLTKIQVSEILGVPYMTAVNRLKSGNWTPDDIEKLADYFGRTIAYYFDREEKEQKPYKLPEEKLVVVEDKGYCAACAAKDKLIALQEKHIELLEFNLGKYRKNGSE